MAQYPAELPTHTFEPSAISAAQEMLGEIAMQLKRYDEYSPAEIMALRDIAASPDLTGILLQRYRQQVFDSAKRQLSNGYPWAMQVFEQVANDPLELIHNRSSSGSLIRSLGRSAA